MMTAAYPFPVDSNEFKDKRVLVTGGTDGMGAATVRRFLLGGARVATTARSPLRSGQDPEIFVQADVSTPDGVREVADHIIGKWGGLDILVNNVGGSSAPNGGFAVLTDDDWLQALNLNLMAAVRFDGRSLP